MKMTVLKTAEGVREGREIDKEEIPEQTPREGREEE
jgi:hypothetical protein